jgi:hypothetical protein
MINNVDPVGFGKFPTPSSARPLPRCDGAVCWIRLGWQSRYGGCIDGLLQRRRVPKDFPKPIVKIVNRVGDHRQIQGL